MLRVSNCDYKRLFSIFAYYTSKGKKGIPYAFLYNESQGKRVREIKNMTDPQSVEFIAQEGKYFLIKHIAKCIIQDNKAKTVES